MLGPSITGASTPFAFGYALFARRQAIPRPLTYTALGLSTLEVMLLAFWLVMVGMQVASHGF